MHINMKKTTGIKKSAIRGIKRKKGSTKKVEKGDMVAIRCFYAF